MLKIWYPHVTKTPRMVLTASEMVKYLEDYRTEFSSHPEVYLLDGNQIGIYDLEDCKNAIEKWLATDSYVREEFAKLQSYPIGKSVVVPLFFVGPFFELCFFSHSKISILTKGSGKSSLKLE